MKRSVYCPVRGSISAEKSNSGVCSAPSGAGGSSPHKQFYRGIAPNSAIIKVTQH